MYIDNLKYYRITDAFKKMSEEQKKALGFCKHADKSWSFWRSINFTLPSDREFGITFNLDIYPDKEEFYLLDESFGQPIPGEMKDGTQYKFDTEIQTKAIIEELVKNNVLELVEDFTYEICPVKKDPPVEIKNKTIYWYSSHLGSIYISTRDIPYDELYCEECGDSDDLIGISHNKQEALDLLKGNEEPETWYRVLFVNKYSKRFYMGSDPEHSNCLEDQLSDLPWLANTYETEQDAIQGAKDTLLKAGWNTDFEHKEINGYEVKIEKYIEQYTMYNEDYIQELVDRAYTKNYTELQSNSMKKLDNIFNVNILSDDKMKDLGFYKFGHNWIYDKSIVRGIKLEIIIGTDRQLYAYLQDINTGKELTYTKQPYEVAVEMENYIDNLIKKFIENKLIKG